MNHSIEGPTDLPGTPGEPPALQQEPPVAPVHQRGQWPAGCGDHLPNPALVEPGGEAWISLQAERASRIVVLGRIRSHLETEPTPRAVRASARRWGTYINAMAEDIAMAMNEQAKEAK